MAKQFHYNEIFYMCFKHLLMIADAVRKHLHGIRNQAQWGKQGLLGIVVLHVRLAACELQLW